MNDKTKAPVSPGPDDTADLTEAIAAASANETEDPVASDAPVAAADISNGTAVRIRRSDSGVYGTEGQIVEFVAEGLPVTDCGQTYSVPHYRVKLIQPCFGGAVCRYLPEEVEPIL